MSLNIYPEVTHCLAKSLALEYGPEIDAICDEIKAACKGWGTDKKLIKAIASCDAETRTKVSKRYEEMHGKALKDVVRKETKGDCGRALQLLAVPPDVAEADIVHMATKGLGTREKLLYPVICGRTNTEMEILKKSYFRTYGKDLGQVIGSETSGDLRKLLVTCVQGIEEEFDQDFHTADKAKKDAESFYKAGQGRRGTDEKTLFKIICQSPPRHVEMMNRAYADKYGYTLSKAMEKEFRGITRTAALHALGMKLKPYETVAHLIDSACAGLGTDEDQLTACIVRYQAVWAKVELAHLDLFGKSVSDRVKHETSGHYKRVLLAVLETSRPDALRSS